MKPILAIETSTQASSVAVLRHHDGQSRLFEGSVSQGSGHAESLLPLIDAVMADAGISQSDIGLVAFGQGPGAFTGIRLGCSVAQGIALSLGLPVVAVNSLMATSAAFADHRALSLVALDARMDEIYFAVYYGEIELQQPVLIAAQDVNHFIEARLPFWLRAVSVSDAALVGEGWQVISRVLAGEWFRQLPLTLVDDQSKPQARAVAQLALGRWKMGKTLLAEQALPLYLRDKVAFTTEERSQGLGGNPKVGRSDKILLLPMMPVDLPEVVELEQRSQAFPWSQKNFEDALAAGYPSWVIRVDDKISGFCVAMPTPDDVHVLVIAVAPDDRRNGLGRRLLLQVEQLAHERGLQRILLEVRPSNSAALAFYRNMGFEQIGVRRNYYPAGKGQREDALVLAKGLNDLRP